jgi:Tfp pilus assembly protein PilF
MADSRLDQIREFVERSPSDARARYFLATELHKSKDWARAAEQYAVYLELVPDDEGVGYRNYGECLFRLGRPEDGTAACRRGIDAAVAHGHDGLAEEIRSFLDEIGGRAI